MVPVVCFVTFCDLVFSQWIQAHGIQICDSKHLNSSGIVTPWCYLKRNDSNGMTFSAVNQDLHESPDIKAVKKLLVLSIVDSLHLFTNLPSTSSSSGEQVSPLNKCNLWRRMQLLRHRFKDVVKNISSEDIPSLIGLIPPYKIPYLTYVETYDQVLKQLGISSTEDHPLNYITKKVQLVGLTQNEGFNGAFGVVLGVKNRTRFCVKLVGDRKIKGVKRENLKLMC
jgi:hypothetical protein